MVTGSAALAVTPWPQDPARDIQDPSSDIMVAGPVEKYCAGSAAAGKMLA